MFLLILLHIIGILASKKAKGADTGVRGSDIHYWIITLPTAKPRAGQVFRALACIYVHTQFLSTYCIRSTWIGDALATGIQAPAGHIYWNLWILQYEQTV